MIKPVCLFGVTERYPVLKWRYMAFHFGTDEVDRHKKSFVKIGREVIEGWLNKYGNLYMAAYSYYKSLLLWQKRSDLSLNSMFMRFIYLQRKNHRHK